MYNQTVLKHFAHPRHVGTLPDPDGYALVASDVHQDQVELFLRIVEGRIADLRYRVHGCVAAIASSSAAAELALGRTLEEAEALTAQDIVEALGGLPESKVRCSVLFPQALHKAIADHRRRASKDKREL